MNKKHSSWTVCSSKLYLCLGRLGLGYNYLWISCTDVHNRIAIQVLYNFKHVKGSVSLNVVVELRVRVTTCLGARARRILKKNFAILLSNYTITSFRNQIISKIFLSNTALSTQPPCLTKHSFKHIV